MQIYSLYSENRIEEKSFSQKFKFELFYSRQYEHHSDSISLACYVYLFAFYPINISCEIVTKNQWK